MRSKSRGSVILIGAVSTALMLAACSNESSGGDSEDSEDAVSLTFARESAEAPPEDNVLETTLSEKIDAEFTLQTTGGEEYFSQLTASLAGGDPPDMFVIDRARLRQLVDQGQVLDLTDHMDELSDYAEFVSPETRARATIDGRDYAIVGRSGYMYQSYWIRKDWLDNLGLQMPETIEDLAAVAKAFTEDDPDGNGKDDTYGITGTASGAETPWQPLWAAFGSGGPGNFYAKDGEIVNGYLDPATKEALAFIQQLVADGVIDPDFVTNEAMHAHERAWQGRAGIIYFSWAAMTKPEFVDQYKTAQPDAEWVQLDPPSGPGGPGGLPRDVGAPFSTWAIPKSLENDEAKLQKIIDLVNYVSSDEGNRLVMYGIEGEHYTLDGDSVVPTDKMTEEGGYFWLYQITGRNDDDYLATKFAAQKDYIDFANNQPVIENYNSIVTPPAGYNAGDASRFIDEQFAQFVSGGRSLDEYDAFVDTLMNEFGYAEYIDNAKEQIASAGIQP